MVVFHKFFLFVKNSLKKLEQTKNRTAEGNQFKSSRLCVIRSLCEMIQKTPLLTLKMLIWYYFLYCLQLEL